MLSLVVSSIFILVGVFFSRQCGGLIGKTAAEMEIAKRSATQIGRSVTQGTLAEFNLVGLTMRLPGRPNERTIPISDSIKATLDLKSKDSYLYQNNTQTISISRDVFIEEFDFASRCDIIFDNLKSVDADVDQRQCSIDGTSGRCFTFNAGNGTFCALLVFNKGVTLWQVQILDVESRSVSAKTLSEAIFSSIRIND